MNQVKARSEFDLTTHVPASEVQEIIQSVLDSYTDLSHDVLSAKVVLMNEGSFRIDLVFDSDSFAEAEYFTDMLAGSVSKALRGRYETAVERGMTELASV